MSAGSFSLSMKSQTNTKFNKPAFYEETKCDALFEKYFVFSERKWFEHLIYSGFWNYLKLKHCLKFLRVL